MRIKLDRLETVAGHDRPDRKPYPSWNEMVSLLHRERFGHGEGQAATPQGREWHDLVADMIIRR